MNIEINVRLDNMHSMIEAAEQSLLVDQPAEMKRILDEKAALERSDHAYQNRTGDLEAATQASELEQSEDGFSVTLAADTEYAEYVNRRGLMQIDERAEEAETELSYYFEGEAARIAGL